MAIAGVRQQHAREECAQAHGEADGAGHEARADHDEQRRGGEDLRVAELGDQAEQEAQHHAVAQGQEASTAAMMSSFMPIWPDAVPPSP